MNLNKIRRIWFSIVHKAQMKECSGSVLPEKDCYFKLSSGCALKLNGTLRFGLNSMGGNGRSSILRMDENATVISKGDFSFFYGADVIVFDDAVLELGQNSFINSNANIRCHKHIKIGDDCAISHNFTVMDSDAHKLDGKLNTSPVEIGNHVWIGTGVTILRGVKVGDGAVISAGSLVTKDVAPNSLVAGVPAKVIKEYVTWEV